MSSEVCQSYLSTCLGYLWGRVKWNSSCVKSRPYCVQL